MDHPMMRLTPAMLKDCVFRILFSIAQSELFKDEWRRSRKWLALGAPLSTDFLLVTPQRITVISSIHEADKWGQLRMAIDVGLSVIPWSIATKHLIKSKFNHPAERQLQRIIAEYVSDAEMLTQTPCSTLQRVGILSLALNLLLMTHTQINFSIANGIGPEKPLAGAGNNIYHWAHGTTPQGAVQIVQDRRVKRTLESPMPLWLGVCETLFLRV